MYQTYAQRPQTSNATREREAYVREYEDERHSARMYSARQAVKRARRVNRQAEEFLSRTDEESTS